MNISKLWKLKKNSHFIHFIYKQGYKMNIRNELNILDIFDEHLIWIIKLNVPF